LEYLSLDYLTNPNKRVFWVYIIASLAIAALYLFYNKKEAKINLSKKLWLHKSALLDYKYFFIINIVKISLIFPLVFGAKEVSLYVFLFFNETFGYVKTDSFDKNLIVALYTVVLFCASDFSRYWLHRWLHTIPLLWEFHKVHHSAKVLNPLTFYRVHPVENLLFGLRYALVIGFVTGVFIWLFGAKIGIYDILGVNILLFLFSLLGSNLRHSHIPLQYPNVLERFFISPHQHQIHHSRDSFDKNYGGYLAIWDSLFGTLKTSKDAKKLHFGIAKEQMRDHDTVLKLLYTPFIGIKRRLLS